MKRDQDWLASDERNDARNAFLDAHAEAGCTISNTDPDDICVARTGYLFKHSPEFRNARLAYRRRVNGSTDAETT